MKRIFVIDWCLVPAFIISAYSGIELHVAGHGADHSLWHSWAVVHVLASLFFLILGIWHVKMHWNWYKAWFANGLGSKSRVTAALSILFLFVCVTGIFLLGAEGANSSLGLWHYRIGLILMLISAGHIAKRWPLLRKSLKNNQRK